VHPCMSPHALPSFPLMTWQLRLEGMEGVLGNGRDIWSSTRVLSLLPLMEKA
jgi:hypothetical protein